MVITSVNSLCRKKLLSSLSHITNGLIKSAQDNLYVGYGTCEVLHSVSADMIVG